MAAKTVEYTPELKQQIGADAAGKD